MGTEHDVRAKLTMDTKSAQASTKSYADSLGELTRKIRGAESTTTGLIKTAMGLGGAYFGLNAGIQMFKSMTIGAGQYTSQLESTKIGLGAILGSVNNLDAAAAKLQANEAFEKIKDLAVKSPAGAAELFQIFNGIVGPLRSAGTSMEDVYKMTNDTVLAAGALGIDLGQAQRDMSSMVRGAAGMDNATFSIMKSMGLIKEDTEEWNRQLTSAERVSRLQEAMKSFAATGEEAGKSFAGQWSTFMGNIQEAQRALISPAMRKVADYLGKVNDYFTEHSKEIMSTLEMYGHKAATAIEWAVGKGMEAFRYIQSHWDQISGKMKAAFTILKEYGPELSKVALALGAVQAARGPAASAVGAAGTVVGAATKVAGWFGGGAAAAGGAAAGAGEAGVAAAGVAATGAAVAFWPLVAALAAFAAVGVALYEHWYLLIPLLEESLMPTLEKIWEVIKKVWGFLQPILEALGMVIITVVVAALKVLCDILGEVAIFLDPFVSLLAEIGTLVDKYVNPALGIFLGWLTGIKNAAAMEDGNADYKDKKGKETAERLGMGLLQYTSAMAEPEKASSTKGTPNARQGTTINVDKMVIKQEFKGDKDPDRVVAAMISDITKQAERRMSTRFAGALTR